MAKNKGKPSGKFAEDKTRPGRKGNYKRFGWPEDVPTELVGKARGKQQGKRRPLEEKNFVGKGRGRDLKAGAPNRKLRRT